MAASPLTKSIVKFNSHTQARDKIYRTIQYGSRIVLWYLTRGTGGSTLEDKLKKLEAALALSRKLFRMGNSLDMGHKALEALMMRDPLLRLLGFVAHTMKALWLLLDHALWCGKIHIMKLDVAWWNHRAAWAWLIGLVAATLCDLVKLHRLQVRLDDIALQMDTVGRSDLADDVKIEMHTMRMNFWRDFCDLFIPLSALQFTKPIVGAVCGLLSSLIGFRLEWEKHIQPFKPR